MSTSKRKIDSHSSNQLSIFDTSQWVQQPPTPGSFNITQQLRELVSEGLKQSSLSRYGVAARMSELLGAEITKSMLDSWTAESKEAHRFPAEFLPAFCEAVGYLEPLHLLAKTLRCHVVESNEAWLMELARIEQAKRELARKERSIREYLTKAGTSR